MRGGVMNSFRRGQVWRRRGVNYGDIISYEVLAIGKHVVALQNCATLWPLAVLSSEVEEFRTNFKLIGEN